MALRRALHRRGLRFVVDRPVPGGNRRRRVDILLRGARVAVFVDGCFWHSCPDHSHLPKTNTSWWRLKFRGIARRDRDTDTQLATAGWPAVRVWEHEDPVEAAQGIEQLVRDQRPRSSCAGLVCARTGVSQRYVNRHACDQVIHGNGRMAAMKPARQVHDLVSEGGVAH
ncbi:very short patch repair endonuclease [Pseudonocardia cypriaca]|nr:very short patch repair endonuclease [Pseudonocardia cypriaca]